MHWAVASNRGRMVIIPPSPCHFNTTPHPKHQSYGSFNLLLLLLIRQELSLFKCPSFPQHTYTHSVCVCIPHHVFNSDCLYPCIFESPHQFGCFSLDFSCLVHMASCAPEVLFSLGHIFLLQLFNSTNRINYQARASWTHSNRIRTNTA